MVLFPDEIVAEIREVHEEVKHFEFSEQIYFGVTCSGFVFYVIRAYSMQPPIDNENDFHTFMLANCLKGLYLLRQRFINGVPREWYLEVEIVPREKNPACFERIREYLEENPRMMEEICGSPHESDMKSIIKYNIFQAKKLPQNEESFNDF